MKRTALCLAFSTVVAIQGRGFDVPKSSVLTLEAKEKIHMLADEHPHLMEILLPEQSDGTRLPISSVPPAAKANAVIWITRVVQERWLPTDIESKLIALKDVKQWERRNDKGIVVYEDIGDFLALRHEIAGYGIHVQESGVTVSLRVDFPGVMPIGDDPAGFIRKCLKDFLNIPDAVFDQLQGDVKEESPVYLVHLRSPQALERHSALLRGQPVTATEWERWRKERQWWDRVRVCTDGHFFFVEVAEAEPGKRGRARPGLPDRF